MQIKHFRKVIATFISVLSKPHHFKVLLAGALKVYYVCIFHIMGSIKAFELPV